MALPKRSISVANAATGVAYVGAGGLYELHFGEVTAVAAATVVRVYDQAAGPVATDPIAVVSIPADRQHQLEFPKGIKFRNGLVVTSTGGDVNGAISFSGSGALTPRFYGNDVNALVSGAVNLDSMLVVEIGNIAAQVLLYDALAPAGAPFASMPLVAHETLYYRWPQGVSFGTGITIDETGSTEGVIYTL